MAGDKKECPDCGSKNTVINEDQQLICRDCGLVYEPLDPDTQKDFDKSHK